MEEMEAACTYLYRHLPRRRGRREAEGEGQGDRGMEGDLAYTALCYVLM